MNWIALGLITDDSVCRVTWNRRGFLCQQVGASSKQSDGGFTRWNYKCQCLLHGKRRLIQTLAGHSTRHAWYIPYNIKTSSGLSFIIFHHRKKLTLCRLCCQYIGSLSKLTSAHAFCLFIYGGGRGNSHISFILALPYVVRGLNSSRHLFH